MGPYTHTPSRVNSSTPESPDHVRGSRSLLKPVQVSRVRKFPEKDIVSLFKWVRRSSNPQSYLPTIQWLIIKLLLYTLAAELMEPLGCQAVQAVASAWGFEHELRRLEATTNSIKNVLLDAEHRQVEDPPVEDWLFDDKSPLICYPPNPLTITDPDMPRHPFTIFYMFYFQINTNITTTITIIEHLHLKNIHYL
ncbi:hypothetical protein Droror1_Dr00008868 [Drosera rotundifolia]